MASSASVRVWDLPTRLFHWLLVGLFGFSWWSGEYGHLDWHRTSGLVLLALLAFRLVWGVIGGSTARFARFVRGPGAVIAYLRGGGTAQAGHNPLGGWSVVAMLALLVVQVGAGLFSVDTDGLESGPLADMVSFEAGRSAAHVHHLVFDALLALVALHLAAIAFYRLRGRNLVLPMLTGRDAALDAQAEPLAPAGPARLVLALGIAVALAWWIAKGAPH